MTTAKSTATGKHDVVQVKNPRTGLYIKIDRTVGIIVAHKTTDRPYKGVPVIKRCK